MIPIHTVAGLKCEVARAARGDQGLLPVVRLELRTLTCGALRAAAAQTSMVACWWDTPWERLPELADWARQYDVWVVGGGPGDVGPSSRGHDLSRDRLAALPELKGSPTFTIQENRASRRNVRMHAKPLYTPYYTTGGCHLLRGVCFIKL